MEKYNLDNLSEQVEILHSKMKAASLLIAVEWAGSARKLSKMCGLAPATGVKWMQRGEIPPMPALSLSRIRGFPLTFDQMCPGVDVRTIQARRCPHCDRLVKPIGRPTESSLLLMGRSESRVRILAQTSDTEAAKHRERTARRRANPPFSRGADCDLV